MSEISLRRDWTWVLVSDDADSKARSLSDVVVFELDMLSFRLYTGTLA